MGGHDYAVAPSGKQYVGLGDAPSTLTQTITAPATDTYILTWADNTAIPEGPNTSPYHVEVLGPSDRVFANDYDAGHGGTWAFRSAELALESGQKYTIIYQAQQIPGGWAPVIDAVSLSVKPRQMP